MKRMILASAIGLLIGLPALAQNTKGTGAETPTSTRTDPATPSIPTDATNGTHRATIPSGTNRGNDAATKSVQSDYDKNANDSSKH